MNFFVGKKSAFSGTSVNSPMSSGVVKFKSRDSPLSASVRLPLPKVASLIEEDPEPSFDERLVSKASRRKWRARAGWGVRGVGGGCLRWLRERGEREEIPPPPPQRRCKRKRRGGEGMERSSFLVPYVPSLCRPATPWDATWSACLCRPLPEGVASRGWKGLG